MSRITLAESSRAEAAMFEYFKQQFPQYHWTHTATFNQTHPVDYIACDNDGNNKMVVEFKLRDGVLVSRVPVELKFCNRWHKYQPIDSVKLEKKKAEALLGYHQKGARAYFVTQWEDRAILFRVTPRSIALCGYNPDGGRTTQPRGGELPDPEFLVPSRLWKPLAYVDAGAQFKSAAKAA